MNEPMAEGFTKGVTGNGVGTLLLILIGAIVIKIIIDNLFSKPKNKKRRR